MNYDLCDALNRKLVKYHQFYDGNWTGKSNLKNPAEFDQALGSIDSELFLEYEVSINEANILPNIYCHFHAIQQLQDHHCNVNYYINNIFHRVYFHFYAI